MEIANYGLKYSPFFIHTNFYFQDNRVTNNNHLFIRRSFRLDPEFITLHLIYTMFVTFYIACTFVWKFNVHTYISDISDIMIYAVLRMTKLFNEGAHYFKNNFNKAFYPKHEVDNIWTDKKYLKSLKIFFNSWNVSKEKMRTLREKRWAGYRVQGIYNWHYTHFRSYTLF